MTQAPAPGTKDLRPAVGEIVGEASLLDPAGYAVDGVMPAVVARPVETEQVSRLLALACQTGARVIPWGGGTTIDRGLPPKGADLVIVLDRLNRVLEHEPADLTVTVEAGITLAELQRALAASGQNVGLDAPLADRATIGGILAANVSGSRRLAFGTARDLVIGMRVVQPDGRITKSGGKVVKNVAGFDLNKLYIGSFGTLAVILEVTFKVAPLPRARATLIVPVSDLARLADLAAQVRTVNLPLGALDVLIPSADCRLADAELGDLPACLAIEVASTPAAVERTVADLTALIDGVLGSDPARRPAQILREPDRQTRFWQAVQDFGRVDGAPGGGSSPNHDTDPSLSSKVEGSLEHRIDLIARLSFRPSLFGAVLDLIRAEFAGRLPLSSAQGWPAAVARAGSGVLTLFWSSATDPAPVERIARLRAALAARDGTLVVERCPFGLKSAIDVWGPISSDWPLMRRIKDQFDPTGILNPGRFVGGI